MSLPEWISHYISKSLFSTFDLKQTAAQLSTGKYFLLHPMMAEIALRARRRGSDLGTQLCLGDSAVRTNVFRIGTEAHSSEPVPISEQSRWVDGCRE